MCDIDKDLVIRGAAYFSTYAAERTPPKLDPFTAALIEKALRARLVPPPAHVPAKPGAKPKREAAPSDTGSAFAAARAALEAVRPKQSRIAPSVVRLLVAFRGGPDQAFAPTELASLSGFPSSNKSGQLHGALERLIRDGFITKVGKGQYQLAKGGKTS